MNKLKIILLYFIFYQNACAVVEPISIGGNCFPAGAMRDLGIRKAAYPFDWMRSKFEHIINAFEDDFNHFLDPESLHIDKNNNRVIVDYYELEFVHDFPTIHNGPALNEGQIHEWARIRDDWKNFITAIKEKYNRRIQRLKSYLEGNDEVIFFRCDYSPLNKDLVIKFRNLIKTKYPQLKFSIVLIEVIPNTFKKWKFENCESFCVPEYDREYLKKWKNIFDSFGIKQNRSYFSIEDDSECCDHSCLKLDF